MGKKHSRGDLPWPVAPIPAVPNVSKEMDAIEISDRLDTWYGELDHWLHIWRRRNALFFQRLPKIEEQVRLLIEYAERYLPKKLGGRFYGIRKTSTLAEYHELLARCLSAACDWQKDSEAVSEFKLAMALVPEAATHWYSYVRHLVRRASMVEAIDEINSVELRLIESEHDSIAQQILNWALAYPEMASGIRADIIKECMMLVSRVGTGLLVRGCPLPHPPDMKWQRTEILRVLWAGMQCSIPIDELCQREGIDEATYYRWRKKYLPPEWGTEPALV